MYSTRITFRPGSKTADRVRQVLLTNGEISLDDQEQTEVDSFCLHGLNQEAVSVLLDGLYPNQDVASILIERE